MSEKKAQSLSKAFSHWAQYLQAYGHKLKISMTDEEALNVVMQATVFLMSRESQQLWEHIQQRFHQALPSTQLPSKPHPYFGDKKTVHAQLREGWS